MNSLEIKLANGHKIVAQLCEYGAAPPEIAVCIQDKDGVALQDIVLVRAKEKEPTVVDVDNPGAEVLVWADEDQEDYTHKFSIDEYHDTVFYIPYEAVYPINKPTLEDGENQE